MQDAEEASEKLSATSKYVLLMPDRAGGAWVVDGADAGPPYVQLANDYSKTGRIAMAKIEGTALAVESAVSIYDLTKSLEDNKDAKIVWYFPSHPCLPSRRACHFPSHPCLPSRRACHFPSHPCLPSQRTCFPSSYQTHAFRAGGMDGTMTSAKRPIIPVQKNECFL